MVKLVHPEKVSLLTSPDVTEALIQQKIYDDPSILGLGDLVPRDKERPQPRAGRLDLLLQDRDTGRRYEVELQLGKTDESHIIRTIEYWDIEKKRYPQYDHCAVIVAEDITSRFLNVVSLFNGFIPLIAIQLNAFKVGDDIALAFTKVLDEMPLGLVGDDEEVQEVTDRNYWLSRGTKTTVAMADEMLEIVNSINDGGYNLNYNKFYIGLAQNGIANNFSIFRPKKKFMQLDLWHAKSDEIDQIIEDNDLDDIGYQLRSSNYRLRVYPDELKKKREVFEGLIRRAEKNRNG